MSRQKRKKIRNLVITSALMAMLLSISTFAWFIGMKTVHVSSFDVEIASTEDLLLSLDGEKFKTTVNINGELLNSNSYEGNTNSWGGEGLIPVSTIGKMDATNSRMILFEKSSLTPSPGGYRLMASKIDNTGDKNAEGYVVFDLFIKNFSGNKYLEDEDIRNEEAIYLAVNSYADVAEGGVANTGIENSVRVAFAQVGRVNAKEAKPDEIRGITCATEGVVIGICRDAAIWEPNDREHVQGALNWYNESCKLRTGQDVRDPLSFGGSCSELETEKDENDIDIYKYYPTYAVSSEIGATDNADIYDGKEYNSYENTNKLQKFNYFTDTDKLKEGTERPEFMYLAPNSITKVRIYIYIEGQDIDNYDFASIGRKIEIKFGFTKERFEPEDIGYEEPPLDSIEPVITLKGENPMTINLGDEYIEPGATALDDIDGDITEDIEIDDSELNVNAVGTYIIKYTVVDKWENEGRAERTVHVVDPDNPENPEEP